MRAFSGSRGTLHRERKTWRPRVASESLKTRSHGGNGTEQPVLSAALDICQEVDRLVNWRWGQYGHNLNDLKHHMINLEEEKVNLVSMTESTNALTATGQLIFQVLESLAEFEANLIREPVVAGFRAERSRARRGKCIRNVDARMLQQTIDSMTAKMFSINEVWRVVGVSRTALYRYLNSDGKPRQESTSLLQSRKVLSDAPTRKLLCQTC